MSKIPTKVYQIDLRKCKTLYERVTNLHIALFTSDFDFDDKADKLLGTARDIIAKVSKVPDEVVNTCNCLVNFERNGVGGVGKDRYELTAGEIIDSIYQLFGICSILPAVDERQTMYSIALTLRDYYMLTISPSYMDIAGPISKTLPPSL